MLFFVLITMLFLSACGHPKAAHVDVPPPPAPEAESVASIPEPSANIPRTREKPSRPAPEADLAEPALPANAKVEMLDSVGWEKQNDSLTAIFNVEIPEFASAAGKRLLVPTALFQPKQKRVLKSGPRKFPVYYHYAFTEIDHITLHMPDGYTMETLAVPQTAGTKFAKYMTDARMTGPNINLDRTLKFGGVFFQPDRYEELRDFFAKVQAADELQTVVRRSTAEAQAH